MPVEIRELVIQARLQDAGGFGSAQGLDARPAIQRNNTEAEPGEEGPEPTEPDAEWVERLVEKCLLRLEARLAEKSLR